MRRAAVSRKSLAVRSQSAAVAETASAVEAAKYGVFRLAYDVSNVRNQTKHHAAAIFCSLLPTTDLSNLDIGVQEDPSLTKTWKKTIKVAVTGASGNISNHLLFMVSSIYSVYINHFLFRQVLTLCAPLQLASGEVFGKDQPMALQLLGSERSKEALEGVAMELEDSLYPLLREVRCCSAYPPDASQWRLTTRLQRAACVLVSTASHMHQIMLGNCTRSSACSGPARQ